MFEELKTKLLNERVSLLQYIQRKLDNNEDFHAISDAANDIREIDSKLQIIDLANKNKIVAGNSIWTLPKNGAATTRDTTKVHTIIPLNSISEEK